ncbi:MAG: hypothetical protein EA341_16405 [Mongoliibacter sp.]|uniref:hypothetical protein n=1 Tax=Mongoliibacter sp. TaxID=2022438 RepID=UPI0012F41BBC|nr:hypothetical protein [Mongoliibacter sp.]TVP44643.1 MAG: hypothetical protein EA341_16405 [Mongoliibacter sp.]
MSRTLIPCLIFTLFVSCLSEEKGVEIGTQLLVNTDFSASQINVSPWTSISPEGFILGVSNEEFNSGSRSVFIESTDSLSLNSGIWRQTYRGRMPAEGRRVRLQAMIKGENITSNGSISNVFISIRAFPVEDSSGITSNRFVTSQNRIRVNGTFDWQPIEVSFPQFPGEVDELTVFLVMGGRTFGKVYFDDVTLTVE